MFMTHRLKVLAPAILICGAFIALLTLLVGNKHHVPVEYFLENTMNDYDKEWPTEVLNVFEEPTFILRPKGGSERFRFLMLRSLYHSPVIVRIERSSNGTSKIYAKVGFYASELLGGPLTGPPVKNARIYERKLSDEEFSNFKDAFSLLNICKPSSEKNRIGFDGSNWLFEYRSSNVHCVQYIWSPEDETKHSVAELMFSLAKMPMSSIGPIY